MEEPRAGATPQAELVEQAVAGLPGIAHAAVVGTDAERRLRVHLELYADPTAIARGIAELMSARFGLDVDLERVRARRGPSGPDTGSGGPPRPWTDRPERRRPALTDLDIRHDGPGLEATVVLEHGIHRATGRAVNVATELGELRAVAEATVDALRGLCRGSLVVSIDEAVVRQQTSVPTASVAMTILTSLGEERLLGASALRDDPERAVARATLDALNRRVSSRLVDPGQPPHRLDRGAQPA